MNGRVTKTGLFLMELLLVILFFSLASVVCLRMFATAGLRGRAAVNLSEAVVVAQSAAESFRAADADPDQTARLLEADCDGQRVLAYYDSAWQQADENQTGGYALELTADGPAAQIRVTDEGGKEIYALTVRVPGGEAS